MTTYIVQELQLAQPAVSSDWVIEPSARAAANKPSVSRTAFRRGVIKKKRHSHCDCNDRNLACLAGSALLFWLTVYLPYLHLPTLGR